MGDHCHIDVRFFAPPEDLSACFTTFYRLEVDLPDGEEVADCLQPEWANLRFFADNPATPRIDHGADIGRPRFQATGPSSVPTHFALGKTRMWGMGLFPLGWARFVRTDASDSINIVVDGETHPVFAPFRPLCDLLCDQGGDDDRQFAAIVDFFRNLAGVPRDARRIQAVHEILVDPQLGQVEDFAQRSGMSKRTLERVCARHFGFSPSLLVRRQRLMRTLTAFMLAERANWSTVIDSHYHDQSHFVHEFHGFMGMSPSEYATQPHPILSAFMTERKRVWGSPAQTLDRPK